MRGAIPGLLGVLALAGCRESMPVATPPGETLSGTVAVHPEPLGRALTRLAASVPERPRFRWDAVAPPDSEAWKAWDADFAEVARAVLTWPKVGAERALAAADASPEGSFARTLAWYLAAACRPACFVGQYPSEEAYAFLRCGAALSGTPEAATPWRAGLWDPPRRFEIMSRLPYGSRMDCGVLWAQRAPPGGWR